MCGRYCLSAPAETIVEVFGIDRLPEYLPRYNIAPTTPILGIRAQNELRSASTFRWGLIPFWADNPKGTAPLINARSETAHTKPSFKAALQHRRLLLPVSGFFEWVRDGAQKTPFYFQPNHGELFAFGGLWERWFDLDGTEVQSATILTTAANTMMQPYHHRMPVIVPEAHWAEWLDPKIKHTQLNPTIMEPAPDPFLRATQVTAHVNRVANQGPECVHPASEVSAE